MTDVRVTPSRRVALVAVALVVAGAGAAAIGLGAAPDRVWVHLLVDGFYFLSLGVSALFFAATQRLSGARWSAGLRRIPEAFMLTLPVAAALMAVVFLGRHALYPWADPGVPGRFAYLHAPFVYARMVVILVVWIVFAVLFRRTSIDQDRSPDRSMDHHRRLTRYAAVFIPVFALTFTVAAYDWIISLSPDWFSTMFAVYVFAGTFVQGLAATALATVILRRRGLFPDRSGDEQLGDLGKLLFAFSTFWAYIWVCQYLLIWYGNIPEEATYYASRTSAAWLPLFAANFLVNWVVPFVLLLSARAKRSPRVLAGASVVLLLGHWLDVYLLVAPSKWAAPRMGAGDAVMAAGCCALVYLVVARSIARAPLVPLYDPVLWADRGGKP